MKSSLLLFSLLMLTGCLAHQAGQGQWELNSLPEGTLYSQSCEMSEGGVLLKWNNEYTSDALRMNVDQKGYSGDTWFLKDGLMVLHTPKGKVVMDGYKTSVNALWDYEQFWVQNFPESPLRDFMKSSVVWNDKISASDILAAKFSYDLAENDKNGVAMNVSYVLATNLKAPNIIMPKPETVELGISFPVPVEIKESENLEIMSLEWFQEPTILKSFRATLAGKDVVVTCDEPVARPDGSFRAALEKIKQEKCDCEEQQSVMPALGVAANILDRGMARIDEYEDKSVPLQYFYGLYCNLMGPKMVDWFDQSVKDGKISRRQVMSDEISGAIYQNVVTTLESHELFKETKNIIIGHAQRLNWTPELLKQLSMTALEKSCIEPIKFRIQKHLSRPI